MPHDLKALRRRRLGDALDLDTRPLLTRLEGLFFDLISGQDLAAIATGMAIEPGPIIARALIALLIPLPTALGHPLCEHIHHLAVLGLVVEEVLGNAYQDHLPLLGDLDRLHKRLDLARLHGKIHDGTERDDEHDTEDTGKAKPQ